MKSIYRTLMNEALREPLTALSGRVLDLASVGGPSYRRHLQVETTEIVSADVQSEGVMHVDFNAALPYKDAKFEAVLFINAVYIAERPEATLREIRRILKPGGTFVLVTPFIFPEAREPHDYFRWTSEGVERAVFDAGFKTVTLRPFGGYATSALNIIEPLLYFRGLKWLAQWTARTCDHLVPLRLRDRRPCPLGYVVICHR